MATARSLNKVILIGNLTRSPALRKTNTGAVVATFGIATNASWRDASGSVQERTEFHNVVAWNKLAEICAQILNTGMLVYVEGELRTRIWEDENGKKHYRTEIKANDMKLLDSKDKKGLGIENAYESEAMDAAVGYEGEEAIAATSPAPASASSTTTAAAAAADDMEEEVSSKEVEELF